MINDIVAFIRERLDEDERIAKNCLDVNVRAAMIRGEEPPRWEYQDGQVRSAPVPSAHITRAGILRVGHTWPAEGEHIARHDPASVLAGVAAKRRILGNCLHTIQVHLPDLDAPGTFLAERVIKLMALEWVGHPQYYPPWSAELP